MHAVRLGWVCLCCLCLFWVSVARADETPALGVRVPWGSAADHDLPTGVFLNPAGLAFQEGWAVSLHHNGLRFPWSAVEGGRPQVSGDGDALYWAMKPLSFLAMGGGIQAVYADSPTSSGAQTGAHLRLTGSGALKLSSWLSLGGNVHAFLGDQVGFQGLFQFDVGLIWRPWNFLSAGLMVRNLSAPRFGDKLTRRAWELGLSLRPLLSKRWAMSADVQVPEGAGRVDLRYRMELEPVRGWVVGGSFSHSIPYAQNVADPGISIGTFMELRFGNWGIRGVGSIETGGRPTALGGLAASVWLREVPEQPLVRFGGRMVMLDLGGALPERDLSLSLRAGKPTFLRVLMALYRIAKDPKVTGLLLRLGQLQCGIAKLEELRKALLAIKKRKKTIVVYANSANLRSYFIASLADKIFLNPVSNVWLKGLSIRHLFWAKALANVGIKAQFVKIGKFKTAPNTYTKSALTPAHRKASRELLDDLFGQLVGGIALGRKKKKKEVLGWFAKGIFPARIAKKVGLIDDYFYWDEFESRLSKHIKKRFDFDIGYVQRQFLAERWHGYPKIAVIYIDGAIVSGANLDDPLFGVHLSGSRTIIRLLLRAQSDPNVKAVVLRVNSPGGAVVAADLIWRYVAMLKRAKPVIVSMGDVAASGGYYVSAPAHEVFASPSTITGSIGIYAGKFDFSGLLKKIEATVEIQKRGEMADLFSPLRPFSSLQRKHFFASIEENYNQFLDKVSKGRGIKLKILRTLAAGRVWSGTRAKKHGLVDELGGLWDAIQRARRRARIHPEDRVDIVSWPRWPSWRVNIPQLPSLSIRQVPSTIQLLQGLQRYKQLFSRMQQVGVWAVDPTIFELH